jgi:AraC family transcriptional regulator
MRSSLERIKNWDERLVDARWQAKVLALKCGVGVWELRHYVRLKFGLKLHMWITARRMARAAAMLRQGTAVKIVSSDLGYKQPSHFSREFKRFHGATPSDFQFTASRPE